MDDSGDRQFNCIYFGFASNISPRSLQQRCPGALYVGIGRLPGWRFIMSDIGYGNIVLGNDGDEVYGNLYFLTRQHEEALDRSEQVPKWHSKMNINVRRVVRSDGKENELVDGQEIEVMTYVDEQRTGEGKINKEYIPSFRKAIVDGQQCGIPATYFEKYMAKYLEDGVGQENFLMLRTMEVNREDLQYVPKELLKASKQ